MMRRLAAKATKAKKKAASPVKIKIGGFTSSGIDIKLEFANPHAISREGAPAKMSIKFKPNVFFSKKTMKAVESNFKLEVKIPKQLPSKEDADFINIIAYIIVFLLGANIAACLLIHFVLPLTLCGKDDDELEIADAYSRK